MSTIIRTSIDKSELDEELTNEDIENKIAVTFQPLLGKQGFEPDEVQTKGIPWGYIAAALAVLAVVIVVIIILRRRRQMIDESTESEVILETAREPVDIPDLEEQIDTEETLRRKQIEKMARERPEEFAKLIRTWLSQE